MWKFNLIVSVVCFLWSILLLKFPNSLWNNFCEVLFHTGNKNYRHHANIFIGKFMIVLGVISLVSTLTLFFSNISIVIPYLIAAFVAPLLFEYKWRHSSHSTT